MANSYKNIIIVPNVNAANGVDPYVSFRGANTAVNTEIALKVYPDSSGTLSFEGTSGQLFSITNDLTGTIFSVNDISGIPSLEIDANGIIQLAQFDGNVRIGNVSYDGSSFLSVANSANIGSLRIRNYGQVIAANGMWTGPNTGLIGPQGAQGFQGNTGAQGSQGFQGNTGSQGSQGFQGNTGSQGNQGFQGNTGSQGSQGFQGNTGFQGNQGNQGFQGNQGTAGAQGNQGTSANNYTTLFGDNSNTSYTITHNLNSNTLFIMTKRESSGVIVYPDLTTTNANTVNVSFTIVPTVNEYRINIISF